LHKEHELPIFTEFTFARTQQNLQLYRFTQFTMARRGAKFTNLPNLPLQGERSLLSIMPYTVTA
jgi:hypothetical protein